MTEREKLRQEPGSLEEAALHRKQGTRLPSVVFPCLN